MLKVHFHTHHDHGIAMHKIAQYLMEYKPDEVEVTSFADCDINIEHIIGDHGISKCAHDKQLISRMKQKKFVLLWYCFERSLDYIKNSKFFNWAFSDATMIYSYLVFENYGFKEQDNVVYGPLGYDHTFFKFDNKIERLSNSIMSTGYIASTECLEEIYNACKQARATMFHVGHNFNWNRIIYRQGEKLTEEQMRLIYASATFVSGLRRGEGFEIPVLEGAACGARPIVFNKSHYQWYKDFAIFIEESNFYEVRDSIYNVLLENINNPNITTSEEERKKIRETFGWDVIAKRFWEEVLRRV